MPKWLTIDRIVGLALLAASVFYFLQAIALEDAIAPFFRRQAMRMDTMPYILGIVAIIASVITIIAPNTSVRQAQDAKVKDAKEKLSDLSFDNFGDYDYGKLAVMIAMMCVYAAYLRAAGFIPSTAVFLFLGSLVLGERRWIAMIMVAAIAPTVIWLLVTYVLERRIPAFPPNWDSAAPLQSILAIFGLGG